MGLPGWQPEGGGAQQRYRRALAKDGYARTVHRYAMAGHYPVRVERTNGRCETAVVRPYVRAGME